MGVPKLYKYLSERYPSLCQIIPANKLPRYDYLYIDLNFVLHKAVDDHNLMPLENADDGFLTEPRIFERVFRYIETLHRIIPSKVMFLAFDGVAPRAKWATQRKRRLHALEQNNDKLSKKFDTNCISPGTTFMHNFEKVLVEFITNKMKSHKNWQNCEVFVSGSNFPGEGSLKIIDFIRSLKQLNNYKPNETHCIYSGDNDYLLLGIAVHELYISIVQEPKRHTQSLGALCADDIKHNFSVIHFEMLRQYLRMEFIDCQDEMNFTINMDNVADDWVVLMTLIGNDYLPGLPSYDLEANILTVIYDAYKQLLKTSNGYISEFGTLNMRRFARLLQLLKTKDFDIFRDRVQQLTDGLIENDAVNSEQRVNFSDFIEMKDQYYVDQLNSNNLPDFQEMSINYVKTVQWICFYYFRHCYSWNHYYPHNCAPFVSDFSNVHGMSFSFELDKPAKPFTHLLAILPKSSAQLLPTVYQPFVDDDISDLEGLFRKARKIELILSSKDMKQNLKKPMIHLQYENDTKNVKFTEIYEKTVDKCNEKGLQRPYNRNNVNFEFSTLYLHEHTNELVAGDLSKPNPRMVIKVKAVDCLMEIDVSAQKFLSETVYVDWPHCMEAKVVQVFDVNKKYDASSSQTLITDNPCDFSTCVEMLNAKYAAVGIDVGEIKVVAFVMPLKYVEYKPVGSHTCELVEHWNSKWEAVAVQTMFKRLNILKMDQQPKTIPATDAITDRMIFLFRANSPNFGLMADIVDARALETHGRINILCYKSQEANFENAKKVHMKAKTDELNEFKQLSTAASLIGIGANVLAKITGSIMINPDESSGIMRKVNIGLQLKTRNPFQNSITTLPDYVMNINNKYLYSQKAIELVKQYLDKFPRIFEHLASNATSLSISDLEENNNQNGLEYLTKIHQWLLTLPHFKKVKIPSGSMQLSEAAIKNVLLAVDEAVRTEPQILKLKWKWQHTYIPDLNSVFVIPCPDAVYKLLDRIVIVRSGYPFPIGSEGTVVRIVPTNNHIRGTDITDDDLYSMDILMDTPYEIQSESMQFKSHRMFRTRSTNMLLNIAHGRTNQPVNVLAKSESGIDEVDAGAIFSAGDLVILAESQWSNYHFQATVVRREGEFYMLRSIRFLPAVPPAVDHLARIFERTSFEKTLVTQRDEGVRCRFCTFTAQTLDLLIPHINNAKHFPRNIGQ